MMTYNNANCANLPTTPAPAPQKSYDKRDRAVSAGIKAIGPQAILGFDFDVYKCDGRWMFRLIDEDKRPPVSDQQVKANGGKKAISAYTALTIHVCPDCGTKSNALVCHCTKAGEAVASAAVEKIMAERKAAQIAKTTADKIAVELMGTPVEKLALEIAEKAGQRLIDTSEDDNGFPKFLKREGDNSVEVQTMRVEKHKKTTGPDRQIKNPPDTDKSKAKAKKEKKTSIAFVAKSAIMAGKDNAKALAEVLAVFPACGYKEPDVQWYRRKLVKDGKLKDVAKPSKTKK